MPDSELSGRIDAALGTRGRRTNLPGLHSPTRVDVVVSHDPATLARVVQTLSDTQSAIRTPAGAFRQPIDPTPVVMRPGHLRPPQLDAISGIVEIDGGLGLGTLERFLVREGWSLSGLGWDLPEIPVGTWLETGGRGLAWPRTHHIELRVIRFSSVLADGTTVEDGRAPRSAAGADLRSLFVGSFGIVGMLVRVALSIRRRQTPSVACRIEGNDLPLIQTARRFSPHLGADDILLFDSPSPGSSGQLTYLPVTAPSLARSRVELFEQIAVGPTSRLTGSQIAPWSETIDRFIVPPLPPDPVFDRLPAIQEVRLQLGDIEERWPPHEGRALAIIESPREARWLNESSGENSAPDLSLHRQLARSLDPHQCWNP